MRGRRPFWEEATRCSGCCIATSELGVEVEALRLGWAVYQPSSQKSCVRSRALQAVQSWRKGSSERSTCLSPKFVFKAFFFFFFKMTYLVCLEFMGIITLKCLGFPYTKHRSHLALVYFLTVFVLPLGMVKAQ